MTINIMLFLLSPSLVMSKNIVMRTTTRCVRFVEIMGIEPTTYGLQSRRSSQLSYIPSYSLIRMHKKKDGIEQGGHCCLASALLPSPVWRSSGRFLSAAPFFLAERR